MNMMEQLLTAVKDEDNASLLYIKLAEEVETRGLHRSARLLNSMAVDEKRHKDTLQGIIEEVKTIGGLVGATAPETRVYWWVRLGAVVEYEKFDSAEEAKKYVEERTGKRFSEAKWINPYGFTLGPFVGQNYISFFEGDEAAQPTGRHLGGKFSSGGNPNANEGNPVRGRRVPTMRRR